MTSLRLFEEWLDRGGGGDAVFPPFPAGFPIDDFILPVYDIPISNDSCSIVFGLKAVSFSVNEFSGNSLSRKVETTGQYANGQGIANTETKWIRRNSSGTIIEVPVNFTRTYALSFSSGGSYPQYRVSTRWGFQGHSVIVFGTPTDIYRYISDYASFSRVTSSEIEQRTFTVLGSNCSSPAPPPPPNSVSPIFPPFLGTASPPPPPPRKMCGCDCNTIASIIAEHMAEKQRLLDAIKEHVDVRTLEQLNHINKMLQDIDMDLNLQPVIDEMKRVEANLWNGINGGG